MFFESNINCMIIWLVVFVATLLIEFATSELVSVWFSISSIVALILAACGVKFYVQLIVFAILSIILLFVSFKFFRKKFKEKNNATNVDSLIGMEIVVNKDISELENGEGKVRDVTWTLTASEPIKKGEVVIIKKITGNKLFVERKGE